MKCPIEIFSFFFLERSSSLLFKLRKKIWASYSFILKDGYKICWIFWIPQALINILKIWSLKICFDFMKNIEVFLKNVYLFWAVKLIILPKISSKLKKKIFEIIKNDSLFKKSTLFRIEIYIFLFLAICGSWDIWFQNFLFYWKNERKRGFKLKYLKNYTRWKIKKDIFL